jgi:hypothetical protein
MRPFKGDDPLFTACCEKAGVPATHRQFQKWKQGRGSARARMDEVKKEMAEAAAAQPQE